MKTILISKEELIELLDERLENALSKTSNNKEEKVDEDLLTRHDVASKFGVSLVTISAWCKKNILIKHTMNSRVYFYKSEVMEAVKNSKGGGKKNG
ncbi:MAG: helix-turn-helix domain-containing protein [Flavobacteriales bacterium]|nr:helix-turn-helix domain-containing protein [Flavobacteriales bacterium]